MHPADIIASLKKRGYSQSRLAAELGCCLQAVNNTILLGRASHRIATRIASITGLSLEKLWPARYAARRTSRRRAA